jgi:hypothetical protein
VEGGDYGGLCCIAKLSHTWQVAGMAKQAKTARPAAAKKSEPPVRLGRSAITGRFVLEPAKKGGGSVSVEELRRIIRNVLASEKA